MDSSITKPPRNFIFAAITCFTMNVHETFMLRCLELAKLGAGKVAPNPLVGAVLVHENRIIGEGYHEYFGGPHAEVNCLASVSSTDQKIISAATLYVSLEPCAHQGKTPPCSNLIIQHQIPSVIIGTIDPFEKVNGNGRQQLINAGIEVHCGIMEQACKEINKRFFTFHQKKRPYIILKWAESADRKMADKNTERTYISNEITNRLVHRWRTEEAAIMVGTNTARIDNPQLTNRLYPGRQPLRIVIDRKLQLPPTLHLFQSHPTFIFNENKKEQKNHLIYRKIQAGNDAIQQMMHALYESNINSILVEGGPTLLQSFIDADYWDEMRIITNNKLSIPQGLNSPIIKNGVASEEDNSTGDQIIIYKNIATHV